MDFQINAEAENILQTFFKTGSTLRAQRGQTILHGDDEQETVYLIGEGLVRAYTVNSRGEERTLVILAPTEIFPLNRLLPGVNRQIFFEASSSCLLYRTSTEAVLTQARTTVDFTFSLMYKLLQQFCILLDRIDNMDYKYASERLAYRLLYLTSRFGTRQPDGSFIIKAPLSQQIIASSINMSRESVSREFERLLKKGYVRFIGKRIAILDIEALKKEFPDPISTNWWNLV
jgi:CRP-like cAMP-binding protein